jgi:lipid-A-disaccharide synthase
MADAGLERVVRAEDVAHMGITEVIRHMPTVFAKYRLLVRAIKEQRPAAAVLIDFPDVNFRLAKELKKLGVPVVYFVSPQLWAWKRRRLRWVQERVDRMMVIFPFEENFYRARGVKAEFVGHPLAEAAPPMDVYGKPISGSPERPWIGLLPGSRTKEVEANLPEMLRAAELIHELTGGLDSPYVFLIPVASTVPMELVQAHIKQWDASHKARHLLMPPIYLIQDAWAVLSGVRASVVASGTATVLAAVAGNPFVVVYRVSDMTYRVAKRLVKYPPEIPAQVDEAGNLPVGMVNLIAGRRVVPELLQERFTAENVAAALKPLLEDGPERSRMVADLAEVRAKLLPEAGSPGRRTAIQRVADAVEGLLAATP